VFNTLRLKKRILESCMPTSLIILMFRNEIWIHLSYFNNFTTTAGDCSLYQNWEESFEIYNNILFQLHFQRYIRMITRIFPFNNDCHNYVSPYKGVGFLSGFFVRPSQKLWSQLYRSVGGLQQKFSKLPPLLLCFNVQQRNILCRTSPKVIMHSCNEKQRIFVILIKKLLL
jgi:hypothetical protein